MDDPGPAIQTALNAAAELCNFGTFTSFIIVCVAVLILRKVDPDRHRPFKVPFSPFFPFKIQTAAETTRRNAEFPAGSKYQKRQNEQRGKNRDRDAKDEGQFLFLPFGPLSRTGHRGGTRLRNGRGAAIPI